MNKPPELDDEGEPIKGKAPCPQKIVLAQIISHAAEHKYKRYGDNIWRQHSTVPSGYVIVCDYPTYINKIAKSMEMFHDKRFSFDLMEKWLKRQDQDDFPIIEDFTIHQIGFRNGMYDIRSGTFVPVSGTSSVVTAINNDCNWTPDLYKQPCPNFEHLLGTQMEKGISDDLEMLMGRTFFDRKWKLDDWQVAVLLRGYSQTGKSSLLEFFLHMFPSHQRGTLSPSPNETYWKDAHKNKRIQCNTDCPADFAKMLPMDDLKTMTSGKDSTEVNRKYLSSIEIDGWNGYQWFALNGVPNYVDSSGAVDRRLVGFEFLHLLGEHECDGQLSEKLESERAVVMMRVIERYSVCIQLGHGKKKFWQICHPGVLAIREANSNSCPVKAFLQEGSPLYEFHNEPGSYTNFMVFQAILKRHLNFWVKSGHVFPTKQSIEHSLVGCGYKIENPKMCKHCGKKWSKDNCGDHYLILPNGLKNVASTNKVITGMRIIDSKSCVPMWEEAHVYIQGEQIQHERKTYVATAKTKQRPADPTVNNTAWKRIYDDYVRGEVYSKGQEVKYLDHMYTSLVDGNTNILPTDSKTAWTCHGWFSDSTPTMADNISSDRENRLKETYANIERLKCQLQPPPAKRIKVVESEVTDEMEYLATL